MGKIQFSNTEVFKLELTNFLNQNFCKIRRLVKHASGYYQNTFHTRGAIRHQNRIAVSVDASVLITQSSIRIFAVNNDLYRIKHEYSVQAEVPSMYFFVE